MNKIYKMYEMTENLHRLPPKLDFFLLAANNNTRCYNCFNELSNAKYNINQSIIFEYEKLKTNNLFIESLNKNYSFDSRVYCSNNNDDDDVKHVVKLPIKESTELGIDITGFTIPDIFRIFFVLKEIIKISKIHVFYTEPQFYLFKNSLFSQYGFLTEEGEYSGIKEYMNSGSNADETLVLFLGFDKDASNYIHAQAYPAEVVAINGFPSYLPKWKDISLFNNDILLNENNMNESGKMFFARANNPFSAYNTLYDVYEKFPQKLLNICVLGTKPMALGACLFALDNMEKVKVTYLYPKTYNSETTESSTKTWYYIVDL